eukprot:4319357-Pyramimonas_sp.AAC.1
MTHPRDLRDRDARASKGHAEVVRALVELGANIRAQAAEGITPLHLAAEKGHAEVVRATDQDQVTHKTKTKSHTRP